MNKGDIVVRISHNKDIQFTITSIENDIAILSGISIRLIADAPLDDLEIVNKSDDYRAYKEKLKRTPLNTKKYVCGKILHLDGDNNYLNKCLALYKELGIYAKGIHIREDEMHVHINDLIAKYNPSIIVLTGHDSFNNKEMNLINNYKNSLNFAKAVKKIREVHTLDEKIVIAGACQSNFELLIASGANFASSPKRVNIHAYDPAIIAIKASVTSFTKQIEMDKIIKHSYIKRDGLGGVETFGKMRIFI